MTEKLTGLTNTPISATMRRIVFPEKGKIAFEQLPSPGCDPGTVLCETLYTGLTNGTERNMLMGGNYGGEWPVSYGYQNVGRVLAVGAGAQGFNVGDTVFSGDYMHHTDYFMAPANEGQLIIKLPETVDPRHAALFGLAGVGMHDVRRAGTKLGEDVLVVGAGPIGQFTAQAARLAGAIVTVCDINESRLAVAKQAGAHHTILVTTDDESWAAVRQAGPFDVVFEDSGAPILDNLIGDGWGDGHNGVFKQRSRLALIAGRQPVEYNFNGGQSVELTVYHASHFDVNDLEQVCRFTADGLLKISPVIQDVVKIDQALAIYETLRDNPGSLFGVVFDWT
jgi:2-desacetyl-2-hydroxyethyl bacteriochlorophyllide A dehydrogenase